jgi:hypothetical protein
MTTPYTPGGEVAVPIDLTALAIGTRLRTRGGGRARLLANDLLDDTHPCAVAVDEGGSEYIETVTATGRRLDQDDWHVNDIVGVDLPKHRVRVQIVKGNGGARYHYSSDPAQTAGYRTAPGETIIADAIVEVEELTPPPAHPGARHDD